MRTIRTSILVLALSSAWFVAHAQQEVMISQYMFNGLLLNPAYAGSHPYMSGSLLHREQWTGIEGAPTTSILAIDGPLWNNKMGLGFTIAHDRIGISRDMEMAGHYAYRIKTGEYGKLAFGLKAGISLYSARISDLIYWDANDALYQQNISNEVVGKFGFGLYWYDDRSFVGVSVPTLYAADGAITTDATNAIDHYFTQHYYLYAGHVFELNEDFDLKPSVLLKYQKQAPPEVDVNVNALYKDRFWLGIGYRTGDAVVGMVEYQVNPMFRVGYAYDMTTSLLKRYAGGSHEIMLGIDLGKEPIRIKSPRYF
ncbi:MAG: type IX secretion system membrane protein PorP/SprF [Flavobacteriales bacterium]|nr:type IX secretion system membrane protein PorP/SprF [Flavobacteriales bacterium]